MKLDIKNKHQIESLLRLTIRDAAPESYQVTRESLENFDSSYLLLTEVCLFGILEVR